MSQPVKTSEAGVKWFLTTRTLFLVESDSGKERLWNLHPRKVLSCEIEFVSSLMGIFQDYHDAG